ncbi:PREDICTED: LRR receptor [Prunus dulcis]|uniref:PREDICTED: LRR receptor n=1 Tax=Prunus dulcis TaxID=3755 RepID=A0A5E4F555_PRUDU|nr:PREDICTED: LRR receptor [Prunus dulcis]
MIFRNINNNKIPNFEVITIRLLGWGLNRRLKLLFYLTNGSLSSVLHGAGKGGADWEATYDVVLGMAQALAHLHHDCVPAILHGDVKAVNVLLGPGYEPYLAGFGFAGIVNGIGHASMQRITEKNDVYIFGVVLLEKLRGRTDPTMHEMLQALAVAFLCFSTRADDRPMMKDVVAMLTEIRHLETARGEPELLKEGGLQ